jgi:TonB family protein
MRRRRWLAAILGLCAASSFGQVEQTPQKLPVVRSGEMPFYPPLPNMARIQGEVRLRVTTDGSGVASVAVESGQPMLAKAAQDNVRTWKFEPHEPTSFSTLFAYHLLAEPKCMPNKSSNGEIRLDLPALVEITANARGACYDPNDELDLSEPLRVFLTGCEVDGSPTPCESFTIRLYSGSITVTPTRFKESKREGFVVPREFRNLKTYSVSIETGKESFRLGNEDIGFLKGKWRVGIDHAPFKEGNPALPLPATVSCVGFVSFEWGEPGVTSYARCE